MTPLAYLCAALGACVIIAAVAFIGAILFEQWQIGKEIDRERKP